MTNEEIILSLDLERMIMTDGGRLSFAKTTPLCCIFKGSEICSGCYWGEVATCITKSKLGDIGYTRIFTGCLGRERQGIPLLRSPIPTRLLHLGIDEWKEEEYQKYLKYILKTYTASL